MSFEKPFMPLMLTLVIGAIFMLLSGVGIPADAPLMPVEAAPDHIRLADSDEAAAVILGQDGQQIGIMLAGENDQGKTTVIIAARGLSAGFHGVHIHETGRCEGDFSSAGGHYNPTGADHPNHAGDLPPLEIDSSGVGVIAVVTSKFTVQDLLQGSGTAIIIHSGADNFANIPQRYGGADAETLRAGDSGSRAGCGVIRSRNNDMPAFDALYDEFEIESSLP